MNQLPLAFKRRVRMSSFKTWLLRVGRPLYTNTKVVLEQLPNLSRKETVTGVGEISLSDDSSSSDPHFEDSCSQNGKQPVRHSHHLFILLHSLLSVLNRPWTKNIFLTAKMGWRTICAEKGCSPKWHLHLKKIQWRIVGRSSCGKQKLCFLLASPIVERALGMTYGLIMW